MALACINGCQECNGCMACQERDGGRLKVCDVCGCGVYEGDRYFNIGDVIYCEECMEGFECIA